MSTDLQNRPHPSPKPPPPEEPGPKLGLSLTQVIGGALAAMTAAALGSRLSVAGTIVGAALASIIAAVAGSLYTASLRHTRDRVSRVWTGKVRGGPVTSVDAAPEPRPDAATAPARPAAPLVDDVTRVRDLAGAAPGWQLPAAAAGTPRQPSRISWKTALGGALATFALAGITLTGLELATGKALSGGSGTTISQVSEGGATEPTSKPTPRPSVSPSATPTPSAEPSPTPTPSASSVTPSATPTPTPSTSPTPSSSTPATAAPSTSFGTGTSPGLGG